MGEKFRMSQTQELIMLLAGPIPGLVLGVILIYCSDQSTETGRGTAIFGAGFCFINWLNLLPLYPTDGGRALLLLLPDKKYLTKTIPILGIILLGVIFFYSEFYVGFFFLFLVLTAQFIATNDNLRDTIWPLSNVALSLEYEKWTQSQYWLFREETLLNCTELQKTYQTGSYQKAPNEDNLRDKLIDISKPNIKNDLHSFWRFLVLIFLMFVVPVVIPILTFVIFILSLDFSD